MRIAIELNGVLRDTLKKIQQEYEKWYLENPFKEDEEKSDYEVISDLTTLDISKHLKFKDEDEHLEKLKKIADKSIDLVALEKDKIKGAIRTDFILSAEIANFRALKPYFIHNKHFNNMLCTCLII